MNNTVKPTAVVVGGGSGIGEAICECFTQRGWRVIVGDIDEAAATAVAERTGGEPLLIDASSVESVEAGAEAIDSRFGGCDAMVVAAAAFQPALPPEVLSVDLWERVVDLCLRGTYICNVAFGGRMAKRGRGSIVNISSLAAMHSMPLHAYGPAKAAVARLSENLAGEWGRSGVRVNCVTPGITLTPRVASRIQNNERYTMPPGEASALGRIVLPREVAEAIEFLCSPRASAITGANLLVDAGATCTAHWAMFGGPRAAREQDPAH